MLAQLKKSMQGTRNIPDAERRWSSRRGNLLQRYLQVSFILTMMSLIFLFFFIFIFSLYNDARMNVALIMTAVKHGAVVANYCEVINLHKDDNDKLNGAEVKDNLISEEWNVKAKVFIIYLTYFRTY
jgi:hypothetical protein